MALPAAQADATADALLATLEGVGASIRSSCYAMPGPASTGIVAPRLALPGAMIQAGCVAVSD